MDEPAKNNEQLSDSELYDAAVQQEGTQSHEDTATEREVERTAPVAASTQPGVPSLGVEPVQEPAPAVAPPPVVTPVAEKTTEPVEAKPQGSSGGVLVLQWLSYAFWGWFGFSLTVLAGITIGFFMDGKTSDFLGDSLAYPLAAVIVMLLISLVTDFFYARHEPAVKTGAANVIMLLHVVFGLLVAVGALVTIVFAGISMFLSDTNLYSAGNNGQKIAMLTAAIVAVVFGSLSYRMLFGGRKGCVRKLFWLLMSVLALLAIVLSIAGPAMRVTATKDDRLIEQALPALASDISNYTRTNNKLPASLSDVTPTGYSEASKDSVQQLINRHLVTYKTDVKPSLKETSPYSSSKNSSSTDGVSTPSAGSKFYYQLCATYKEAKNPDSPYTAHNTPDYTGSTISTYSHPKGEQCYNLSATDSYYYGYDN